MKWFKKRVVINYDYADVNSIFQKERALIDAIKIINDTRLQYLTSGPTSIWRLLYHAESKLDDELNKLLRTY